MYITVDEKNQIFSLHSKNSSYILKIAEERYPIHLHFGKRVDDIGETESLYFPQGAPLMALDENKFAAEAVASELPLYGHPDMRTPSLHISYPDGSTVTELRFVGSHIYKGKNMLPGLPAVYAENENEAETLELEFFDSLFGTSVILSYTVFYEYDAFTRNMYVKNCGAKPFDIKAAASMSVDLFGDDYDIVHLDGAWGRERHITRNRIVSGFQGIDSKRGASSHNHNPFLAVVSHNAGEEDGEAYGFSLVYSGNFLASAELDQQNFVRVSLGINPFDFNWLLMPGESFCTPETVLVYSDGGIGKMSRIYHRLYRERLCRGKFRDELRPVLINNWQATYFDFNEEKILGIAQNAKKLGLDMVVLDDGWFGCRNNDSTSLGDWKEDKTKLPGGLERLAKQINEIGMKFGLWFEPEMVSEKSKIYKAHPDWCLHTPGRSKSTGRNQLILDFSRNEVCDYIENCITDILKRAPISYIKWDMNRNMTEICSAALPPSRQRETAHRYILGVYKTMEHIIEKFPNLLIESCSAGGGRFDPGMLYYSPQIWTSDDTDSAERLFIQYGTSIVYPASCICAHVSAVPNHQVKRITPLKMRGDVAMAGQLGYELDLSTLDSEQLEQMRAQVEEYKKIQHIVTFGDMYRIKSPFERNSAAFQFVTGDKRETVLIYSNIMRHANDAAENVRMRGLINDAVYENVENGCRYLGARLMNIGFNFKNTSDFQSRVMKFRMVTNVDK